MIVVYVASLIVGLLLGVRVMMFGVEKPVGTAHHDDIIRVRLAPPAIAVFGVVFGLLGYILERFGLGGAVASLVALASASIAAGVAIWGIMRSARVVPEFDTVDPRYALQGQLALVVRPISAAEDGEIEIEVDSTRRVVRARAVGDESVGIGADVVIERIEDDVAYVEPWHRVEQRL